MLFNPLFIQPLNQSDSLGTAKPLKLNNTSYLFSDIIKIINEGPVKENTTQSSTANLPIITLAPFLAGDNTAVSLSQLLAPIPAQSLKNSTNISINDLLKNLLISSKGDLTKDLNTADYDEVANSTGIVLPKTDITTVMQNLAEILSNLNFSSCTAGQIKTAIPGSNDVENGKINLNKNLDAVSETNNTTPEITIDLSQSSIIKGNSKDIVSFQEQGTSSILTILSSILKNLSNSNTVDDKTAKTGITDKSKNTSPENSKDIENIAGILQNLFQANTGLIINFKSGDENLKLSVLSDKTNSNTQNKIVTTSELIDSQNKGVVNNSVQSTVPEITLNNLSVAAINSSNGLNNNSQVHEKPAGDPSGTGQLPIDYNINPTQDTDNTSGIITTKEKDIPSSNPSETNQLTLDSFSKFTLYINNTPGIINTQGSDKPSRNPSETDQSAGDSYIKFTSNINKTAALSSPQVSDKPANNSAETGQLPVDYSIKITQDTNNTFGLGSPQVNDKPTNNSAETGQLPVDYSIKITQDTNNTSGLGSPQVNIKPTANLFEIMQLKVDSYDKITPNVNNSSKIADNGKNILNNVITDDTENKPDIPTQLSVSSGEIKANITSGIEPQSIQAVNDSPVNNYPVKSIIPMDNITSNISNSLGSKGYDEYQNIVIQISSNLKNINSADSELKKFIALNPDLKKAAALNPELKVTNSSKDNVIKSAQYNTGSKDNLSPNTGTNNVSTPVSDIKNINTAKLQAEILKMYDQKAPIKSDKNISDNLTINDAEINQNPSEEINDLNLKTTSAASRQTNEIKIIDNGKSAKSEQIDGTDINKSKLAEVKNSVGKELLDSNNQELNIVNERTAVNSATKNSNVQSADDSNSTNQISIAETVQTTDSKQGSFANDQQQKNLPDKNRESELKPVEQFSTDFSGNVMDSVKDKFSSQTFTDNPLKTIRVTDITKEITSFIQQNNTKSVVLQLKPESLGKIKVTIDVNESSVHARVVVDTEAVRQIVRNNVNELKQSLNTSGMQLNSLTVSLSGGDQKSAKSFTQKRKLNYQSSDNPTGEGGSLSTTKSMGYNTYEYLA